MQRSSSFILLDADTQSSSSVHEDVVKISLNMSKESTFYPEADVPSIFDEYYTNIESINGGSFPTHAVADISSHNQGSWSTTIDGADIAENFPIRSRQCLDVSNESDLSSGINAIDSLQLSSDCLAHIEPEIVYDDALLTVDKTEDDEDGVINVEARGPTNYHAAKPITCQIANFFRRAAELMEKNNQTANYVDTISKCIALCVLLAAVLIPIATICLLPTSKPALKSDFAPSYAVKSDESPELMKCKLALHWKQEKVEQLEIKLERFISTFKELEDSNDEYQNMVSGYQERCTKCEVSLKKTEKQLKVLNDLYESSRNKVLELQEMIIGIQQETSSDRRPFYQQALDKIFGQSTDRKRCGKRSRRRN